MQKRTNVTELDPVHPRVRNTTGAGHSRARPQQQTDCGHKGCDKRATVTMNDHQLKPFKKFRACVEGRGWYFDEAADHFLCPDHRPTSEEPMPTKTKAESPDTAPLEMTTEQRRAIFREIDESYDKNGYCLDVTDKTIGDKLSVPWGWVAQIREEMFGPAGPDPRIKALADKIGAAEAKAQKAYDGALAAAEKADSAVAEAQALKKQLLALLGD